MARKTKFVQRLGKLKPHVFLDSLMFNEYDNGDIALNDHCIDIQVRHNVTLNAQSIDERFNERTVEFVKELLKESLQKQIPSDMGIESLSHFTSVKIKDSTRYQVPASLKEHYAGSGGAGSEAGVSVQFEFDIKTGEVSVMKATEAKRTDTTDAQESVEDVEEGSLIIRDLGYFSTGVFNDTVFQNTEMRSKAYFLSRVSPGVNIYKIVKGWYVKLDLKKEHQQLKRSKLAFKELDVYIGDKYMVPVRLIMELMPDDKVEERMRKTTREAIKKGRMVSEQYKAYAKLGLYMTNAPEEWLAAEHVRSIYRLRWQIELRFKCWKGLCRIHTNKDIKLHRFETYLYACLLSILINWEISMSLLSEHRKTHGKMLSVFKCFKALKQCKGLLREALFRYQEKLEDYFKTIGGIDKQNLLLETHKGSLSLEEILLLKIGNK